MSDVAVTKKLKDQLTCAICLEQYRNPRSLSCLHSFCTGCLERLVDKEDDLMMTSEEETDEEVSCPSCRTITRIPQGKITALPIAFHLNSLLEVQDLLQKSLGSKAICNNCSKEKAMFYCPECNKFLCSSCNDFHLGWSSFSNHKVMGIEEVAKKATKMVSVKPNPLMECPRHNKPLEVYCIKCDQPICYLCTIKDHKGHDHTLVSDVYEECKKNIKERLKLLEVNVQQRKKVNKELEESKKDVQENAEIHEIKINKMCDDFVERIEKVRRLGLQAVEAGTASYIACKDQQIEEEEAVIQALYDCKEYVKCSLEKSTPPQLLLMKKQIMERFEELILPEPDVAETNEVPNAKEGYDDEKDHWLEIAKQLSDDVHELEEPEIPEDEFIKEHHTNDDEAVAGGYGYDEDEDIEDYDPDNEAVAGGYGYSKDEDIEDYDPDNEAVAEGYGYSKDEDIEDYDPDNEAMAGGYGYSEPIEEYHEEPPQQVFDKLTVKDLIQDIFSLVPLQYPQLAYEQCELVADFPINIQACSSSLGTFALLFKGHPMVVDIKKISCFLKLRFKNNSKRKSMKQTVSRFEGSWSEEKEEYPCDVDYSHDDIKYQVSFTPKIAGSYSFHVKVGSTPVSTKIEIKIEN